jgi:AcrR family transcriptional regulator
MSVLAGQGDPRRSLALLWRAAGVERGRPAPGPKPGLTVDIIVDEAIAVADAGGIIGLSMRAVADGLGVTAMALYTYVPGKQELIDLMYDGVHRELQAEHDTGNGWRTALMSWADDLLRFYLRHPWVLQISYARPVLGPNEQRVLEDVVRILRETGLPADVLRSVISVLFHVVRGMAQTITESRSAAAGDGSEREWWSQRSAALGEVVPDFAQRFPQSAWLAHERTVETTDDSTPYLEREANHALATGLTVLLDGIDVALHDNQP